MKRKLLWIAGLLMLAAPNKGAAQDLKAKYEFADGFWEKYNGGYFYGNVAPVWIGDTGLFWYSVKTPKGTEYMLVDCSENRKTPLFDPEKLAGILTAETGKTVEPYSVQLQRVAVQDDLEKMTFERDGMKYAYNLKTNALDGKEALPENGPGYWFTVNQENSTKPVQSPDGKHEAYISEGNLFVKNRETNEIRRMSYDGSPGEYYSSEIVWSPDSKKIVSCKYRPAWIRKLVLPVSSPKDQLQPKTETYDYPKPGDALPVKQPVLFLLDSGKQVHIEFENPDQQYWVNSIRWAKDGESFTFEYNKRGHQEYVVYKVAGENPKAQALIRETSPTFIHYYWLYRYYLEERNEVLWISERDGWRHLYLYDYATGKVKKQLTKGEWIVKRVMHVDEKNNAVYFAGCGRDAGEDPYFEKIYRLDIDEDKITCLTPESGNHKATFSNDYGYMVDIWSRIDLAPVSVVRDTKTGKIVMELEKGDISKALAEGWRAPEPFCAKGRDGKTDIWGMIMRPVDFDPNKKYPVIEYIYAGPHDSFVPKSFSIAPWDMVLAQLGFIVVQIDGMGTANRSKAFHDVCWKNLKDAGFPDRIAWMKAAAEKYPEMDLERVGIHGTSAGAQNTTSALLFHPEFYKVGVASCGCYDNRMDKMWWNEQWMGYPIGKEYEDSSTTVHADKLEGQLMLILGEMDNNVDPASTFQVVNALVEAGKEFEFVMLPNVRHSNGGKYGERKRRDFFVRHLLGEMPPEWNTK